MKQPHYYFLINSLEWGGAERVTINSATKLLKEGTCVYIITLKSRVFYDLPAWAIHIALSHVKNNFLMFLLIPRYILKFKKACREYQLTEGISLLEIANFVHILAKKNAAISFRTHVKAFTWFLWKIQVWLIKYLYPKAGRVIVNSLENKYESSRILHIPLDKIDVVYNTIDVEECKRLSLESLPEDIQQKIAWKKVFITTGRLIGDKGFGNKHHDLIIAALHEVYTTIEQNWIYLIIGDWPERQRLETLVSSLELQDHVLFLGMQKNVFKYLKHADAFLYASEVEWFPNVLVEAKEMWVPIITSDFTCGAKEVILWEYNESIAKNISYPYLGKYWWLLDLSDYNNQLVSCIKQYSLPKKENSHTPHFSIIIPSYNRRELLEKSINSVIMQEWQKSFDWHVVVVDDGSTDDTSTWIKTFLSAQTSYITDRVQYVYQENKGVWAARNTALKHLLPSTDYIILLDSDDELITDCIVTFLDKMQFASNISEQEVIGLYFLCKDEYGEILWKERVLWDHACKKLWYKNYLQWEINTELLLIISSKVFLQEPYLRFPEDVVTEWVMWSVMRKYMENHKMVIILYDYVGRLYRRYHTSFPSITKTVSRERCFKNALWSEKILNYIRFDLEKYGLSEDYAEYLFRIGINFVLGGQKKKGREYLKNSFYKVFSVKVAVVYCLTYISTTLLWKLYSRYIRRE